MVVGRRAVESGRPERRHGAAAVSPGRRGSLLVESMDSLDGVEIVVERIQVAQPRGLHVRDDAGIDDVRELVETLPMRPEGARFEARLNGPVLAENAGEVAVFDPESGRSATSGKQGGANPTRPVYR